MRFSIIVPTLALTSSLALALAGCGNSTPLPAASSSASTGAAGSAYTPSTATFATIPASQLQQGTTVTSCNVDTVNDKPAGSEPLPHAGTATFTGWAADGDAGKVPAGVQLVLKGTQDYAVNAATGMSRPDVAAANHKPALTSAGFSVNADLSAVAPGQYSVVLLFSASGKHFQCATPHKLTVQ